jgi:putative spermidine/putrescine transport system substrate-binding protein
MSCYKIIFRSFFLFTVFALFWGCPSSNKSKNEITICSFGGSFQEAQRKAYFIPFEELTGIKINEATYSGEYSKIKEMVMTENVLWDVVDVERPVLERGSREGIFELIDYSLIDTSNFIKEAIHPYGVGTDFFSTVIAFNENHFPNESVRPKSWKDFWDVDKFPGARSLRKNPRGTLEIALMADGVPPNQLYPLDVDRAFRSLDKIKKHIKKWWTNGNEPIQLLSDGEVVMAATWSGRIWTARKFDNPPIMFTWNEGITDPESWVIPKHSRNVELAMQFISFASQAERQANFTKYAAYGPTNKDSFKYIDKESSKDLPTYHENFIKQVVLNKEWWDKNEEYIVERWNDWLLK